MQTRKSEKSNVELPAFRITGTDPVSRKHRKFFMVIWLVAASVLPAVRAQEANNSEPEQASATKTVVNAAPAAPTVRTASGIVRGVTEDDVSSFKRIPFAAGFPSLPRRSVKTAGVRHNHFRLGRASGMRASLARTARRRHSVPAPFRCRRLRQKIACLSICGAPRAPPRARNCR